MTPLPASEVAARRNAVAAAASVSAVVAWEALLDLQDTVIMVYCDSI